MDQPLGAHIQNVGQNIGPVDASEFMDLDNMDGADDELDPELQRALEASRNQ